MDRLSTSAKTEAGQCERHGAFEVRVLRMGGREIRSACPECERERQEEEARELERTNRERRIRATGIPRRFLDRTLDSFRAETKEQQRALAVARGIVTAETEGASAIFTGPPGTGKTHLGCGICRGFIERGRSARFTTVLSAIRHIKDTYRRDSEMGERTALADFLRPELLVLDEIGVQVGSEHEKMLLFEIINERYQDCGSTVLLTNLTRAEVGDYLGQRVMDRFAEIGAVVACNWDSYRTRRP